MDVGTVRDRQDAAGTRLIAGVSVPDGPLITAAIDYAQRLSDTYLFNHAMRSWLFAETIRRTKGIDYDHEVVAIGTILHDIGLTAGVSGPHRFEVNGADAALRFIAGRGHEAHAEDHMIVDQKYPDFFCSRRLLHRENWPCGRLRAR